VKRHKGNMMAVVLFLLAAAGLLSGALLLAFNQQQSAQAKALGCTRIYSLMAVSDMTAHAFEQDLEGMTADGGAPLTSSVIDKYNAMVSAIQNKLFDGDGHYVVTSPVTLVNSTACDISDEEIRKNMALFLKDTDMTLALLDGSITISQGAEKNAIAGRTGDMAMLGDIHFSVTLLRGKDMLRQTYCLSGLMVRFVHNASGIHASIDGNSAALTLEGRQIGQRNMETTIQREG